MAKEVEPNIKKKMVELLTFDRLRRPSIQRWSGAERTKDADKLCRKGRSGAEGSRGPGAHKQKEGSGAGMKVTTRVMMTESEGEKAVHTHT